MLKRLLTSLFLSAGFLFAAAFPVFADSIIEPDNDFYTRNRENCVSIERVFYANGDNGFISLKEEPGAKAEVISIENGETIYITFGYNYKNELWGLTAIYTQDGLNYSRPSGWIPLSQLLLIYDYRDFAEQHQEEFYQYSGANTMLNNLSSIVFWSWPGSGEIERTLKITDDNGYQGPSVINSAYTDEQGREWGFIDYWQGSRNVWICLSDPESTDIPAFNPAPPPRLWQQDGVIPNNNAISAPVLAVILVLFLTALTGVLIRVFWKPVKNDNMDE